MAALTSFTAARVIGAFSCSSEGARQSSSAVSFPGTSFAGASLRLSSSASSGAASLVSRRVLAVQAEVEESVSYSQAPPAGTKLYIGNLPFNVDSETLAGVFSSVAEVDQVDVIYDRETGRSRGFGFVTMSTTEGAEAAIQRLDGSELGGRMLKVNFPAAKGERPLRQDRPRPSGGSAGAGNKLYVGNLSWGMDDYGLADLFAEFGQVMEAKVVLDRETGKSRGFGFVTFNSPTEGSEAVRALDGVEVDGRQLRVNVAEDRASRPRF
eukprot:TRINITY_DN3931_c0_g1_i1.p1 TRINITY_DN3931_c0_g1~~TRINITY_DN3931_c0_g1_i1.p1  ORF type:complete len:267 (+),score=57.27 TRINITY_DN3931_c0_g1_i1:113-913(+)